MTMIQRGAEIMVKQTVLPSVPLSNERRAALPTSETAAHLGRKAQTLRAWACKGTGPIKPLKINGRLAWQTADVKRLLGMQS